jgi:predicted dehydrogenase
MGSLAVGSAVRSAMPASANDTVRVACVGVRGQGRVHVSRYGAMPNVEVAAICDIDESVQRSCVAEMEKAGKKRPAVYTDIRKLLEDKSIDAVSIATPNHHHTLQTIWACQAGKDVYVEKPCSHDMFEARQIVAAARKYNRLVQHGTNSRSSIAREAIKHVHEGLIGDVYMARGLCFKWRDTIGRKAAEPVPAGVHYDLWLGPAPEHEFTQNRFHYNWHWFWDYGNGDMGNQGIHQVDVCRWGLGVKYPTKVSATGGHFMFDDDQETPNTLNAAFEFKLPSGERRMLEFEVRHWLTNTEAEIGTPAFGSEGVPPVTGAGVVAKGPQKKQASQTVGNIFYGSKGYMAMDGYDSYKTWLGEGQEPGPHLVQGGNNWANFIECVRSRKKEDLHAPIEEGHISSALVHLANASYRLGRTLNFDPETEQVIGDDEANQMLRGTYREPFVVPEKV